MGNLKHSFMMEHEKVHIWQQKKYIKGISSKVAAFLSLGPNFSFFEKTSTSYIALDSPVRSFS